MVVWFANAVDFDVNFRVRDDLRWHAVHSAMAGLVCSSLGTENGRNVAASPALRPLSGRWNCMQLCWTSCLSLFYSNSGIHRLFGMQQVISTRREWHNIPVICFAPII